MSKELEFFQINLHKAYAPTTELNNLVRRKDSFIALIQEPVARLGTIKGINRKKGNIIHAGGNVNTRAAIYCSKNISIHPLYHISTRDQAVAMITVKKDGCVKNIIICSSYFPYNSDDNPPTPEFTTLTEYCKNNSLSLISGIDTNAHHFAWGSTDINERGDSFFEFIVATDLTILNIGNKPTFRNKNRKEVLDITLCTKDLTLSINDWEVSDYILTSDHVCITFKVSLDPIPPILFRNPESANWQLYSFLINKKQPNSNFKIPANETELDEMAGNLQDLLVESYEKACPIRKHKAGNSVPYYTSEDKKQRQIVRREFNKCRALGIWTSYYDALRLYNKTLRIRERTGWKDQCSQSSQKTLPKLSALFYSPQENTQKTKRKPTLTY